MPGANRSAGILRRHGGAVSLLVVLALLPFLFGLLEGASPLAVWNNQAGTSKFYEGLLIEVFILAVYAISYDLVLGITGLLSFGHAMFFAVGAYLTGILLKSFGLPFWAVLLAVVGAGVLNALLFSVVLPRVKGITFALVTLGFAAVFNIVIQSHELSAWAGGDVGLQNVPIPAWLSPSDERLRFYFVALVFLFAVYWLYQRFVDSPTGRVCIAIRENEERARVLGYPTFYFKVVALTVASVTAGLTGALHTLYQPIVSPTIAGLGFTVAALLMILIGGIGTLTGALLGAAVYRLVDFFLLRYTGSSSSFLIGLIYIAIVLFVPYGVVGTWRLRNLEWRTVWQERLAQWVAGKESPPKSPSSTPEHTPE